MDDTPAESENLSPLKQAILRLRELRADLDAVERAKTEPIAIIGLGLRFPGGANDPEAFWRLLREGVDAIVKVPHERWDADAYFDPDPNAVGKMSTRYGAFLDGIDLFEPQFFGISPREAASMDPQQRLLLEVGWEALENAGLAPSLLADTRTGVYVGICNSDYFRLVFSDPTKLDVFCGTGNVLSVAAGRLSYLLGLHGPNMAIDTACSSSLVALHLACQSLRGGECDLALTGGVNLILTPEITINHSRAQMMAPDGRCKTFDAGADGYGRGEGCAVVILKRLSDAVVNGDRVLALIRGTAINHDGRSSGLTAPNGPAQEAVICEALANARVEPYQVSYVETHGTGTPLGDPIEVQALGAVLGKGRSANRPLFIGSVKTNIGHLEAASGVAGLVKVVLALQKEEIPPNLHFHQPNPYIPWDKLAMTVPVETTPWPRRKEPRIAGLSSFGLSGTNAHLVLEEAPAVEPVGAEIERPLHILTLSARSEGSLKILAEQVGRYLIEHPESSLADICFTANAGRSHFEYRMALIAGSTGQAAERLKAFDIGQLPTGAAIGRVPGTGPSEVVFLFTGQGSRLVNVGRSLYDTQPTFRRVLDQCDALLRPHLKQPLLSALYPESGAPSLLADTEYAQPALFALEYALASLWRSWGVEPTAVMGHSLGEYVAACVAGVFTLEDGLRLVAARGRLTNALSREEGEMLVVYAGEERVAAAIAPYAADVSIAAVNGPDTVVISGRRHAVQKVLIDLHAQNIETRTLQLVHGFHSPLIEPVMDSFEAEASTVKYSPPQIALVSGVTGQLVTGSDVTLPAHWRDHLRQPVKFGRAMETLLQQGYHAFLEMGPHPTLIGMARRYVTDSRINWLPSLRNGREDWEQILESLGSLYVGGLEVDWIGFDRDYPRNRVPLPTYPWQRKSYWWGETRTEDDKTPAKPSRWESLLDAGRRQAQQAPLDLSLQTIPAKWRCLDRLATALEVRALRELGAFSMPGEVHTAESLHTRFGVSATYRDLLNRWLRRLAIEGMLQEKRDEVFVSPEPLPDPSLDSLIAEAREQLKDVPSLFDYVQDCGNRLSAIITGKASPLDPLFQGGSFARAEDLYQHWALARYFSGIASAVVQIAANAAEQPLHILEIGAGTGALTSALLPILASDRASYYFSDVSDLFLKRARQKFASFPFVQYGLLNIEQDPQEQGYPRHGFDLVVASNVLHATRDLRRSLRHAQSLLSSEGLLLLHETTSHLAWFDVTVGLVEGWQRFDDETRGDSPLLSASQWEKMLLDEGYEAVGTFPEAGSLAEILGQHVFLALAPCSNSDARERVSLVVFDHLHDEEQSQLEMDRSVDSNTPVEILDLLREALPGEREELLINFVCQQLARVLRVDSPKSIDPHRRLMDLGVDSLMAVELRSLLSRNLGLKRDLPATLVFDHPTVQAIADYLVREVMSLEEPSISASSSSDPLHGPRNGSDGLTGAAEEIEQLSDEEVEALLIQRLKSIASQDAQFDRPERPIHG